MIAVRQEYCDAVYHEVMRRINSYAAFSQISRFLIDVEDKSLDTAVLVPCTNKSTDSFVVVGSGKKDHEEYIISSFIRETPCSALNFQINENQTNYIGARWTVNGQDKAQLLANYAILIYNKL